MGQVFYFLLYQSLDKKLFPIGLELTKVAQNWSKEEEGAR
jgi:hypothetical protein